MKAFIGAVVTVILLLAAVRVQAAADQPTEAVFKNLITAAVANDYDGFVADCDDAMKAITKTQVASVSKQLEPRVKGGYEAEYLGDLKQRGYVVSLWRLRFKDGGDDILATLSIKDGKVGGFFLH